MKKITIELNCGKINLELEESAKAGIVYSDLNPEKDGEILDDGSGEYTAAIETLESLVLAHACAGIDVTSLAYIEGLNTTLDNIGNNYGE